MERRTFMTKSNLFSLGISLLLVLGGCTSIPEDQRDPQDPLESYNRAMFDFNTDLDNAFIKPISKGWVNNSWKG